MVRAFTTLLQRVSLMAKRLALNQSLASAARQAVAQRDHPDALGWQWQVTAYAVSLAWLDWHYHTFYEKCCSLVRVT
ncbi:MULTISPECIES: hypothetical protein [Mesorhizobium]|uniref:hypothetical protein n=1 Tax=Mesorhizobium TaxID=68287 RepID=UPI001140FF51|nr:MULTISPECIES: hypothetical protein [Mesorhizobium]QIA25417.1 hypothetical protein A9K68_029550 [Mesorhizobium sp. AA22]